jgi:hypothetical protein
MMRRDLALPNLCGGAATSGGTVVFPFPQPDEYYEYYGQYIKRVPQGSDILALMRQQPDDLQALLNRVTDEQARTRPAPEEWSINEVVGHITDTERIFAYRALCIARADATPLPGFDQDDYVRGTDFNSRTLPDLIEEFTLQRRANVLCFRPLNSAEAARRGTASGYPFSVRALLYCMVGHVMHHIESLKVAYKAQG